jgi:hypothetical protein
MRVGDYIDDYCSRCKRVMDHGVVSVAGEEALRTRCRTCDYEHAYKSAKGGRKEMSAKQAFDTLMASVTASGPLAPPAAKPKRRKK